MLVYKVTNTVNGKVYIGQTINSIKERWYSHCYDTKNYCSYLKHAINKYGEEAFTIEVIDQASDLDSLTEKEAFWISHYNSTNPEKGYNIRKAQKGLGTVPDSLKALIGKNTKEAMGRMSDDAKLARKEASKKTQIEKGIYARVAQERSKRYSGTGNPRAVSVCVVDKDGKVISTFSLLRDLAKYYGIGKDTASLKLNNGTFFKKTRLRGYRIIRCK